MSMVDDLKGRFFKFRRQKYAIYVGLVLTFILCSLLLVFAGYLLCFGLLLVALVGYYIPYFFGMKSKKKLAIWGIVLILLLSIPFGITIVGEQQSSANQTLSTSNGAMIDGTVTPFKGDASTNHTFSVLVTDPNYVDVRAIVYDVWTGSNVYNATMTGSNVSGGTLYTFSTTLQNNTEYGYWFGATNGTAWVTTSSSNYGPMHVSDVDLYAHWIPLLIVALLVEVGVLYYLLLGLNWMSERSKARMAGMQKKQEDQGKLPPVKGGKEEKFVCSECGAEVPGSSAKCPQCGESFDEEKKDDKSAEKKDEFICTECGAKVDENAKTCWNCGKEFEN